MQKISIITLFLMSAIFFGVSPAFAYLDAGSGSMILQLLLGGVAGLAIVVKLYWKGLLVKLGIKKEEPNIVESKKEGE
jgi:hypothetical protein